MDFLYSFIYRGILAEESLDKVGRRRRRHARDEELAKLQAALSYEMLDPDLLGDAQRMAIVYTAIHTFENSVRQLEDLLGDMEWAKTILGTLERSRNIIMHGGVLVKEDVERIGVNIRDWIRQAD